MVTIQCGGLLESRIWFEPATVKLVWLTLVLMADDDGLVLAADCAVAHRAVIEPKAADQALLHLSDGGYIRKVSGGFQVTDVDRWIMSRQTRVQKLGAARVRKHRAKKKEEVRAGVDR